MQTRHSASLSPNPFQQSPSSVDVVLIQNGTSALTSSGAASCVGWDVVFLRSLPSSSDDDDAPELLRGTIAARDFLIACVYRGAEVGGLRDLWRWAGLGTRGGGRAEAFPDLMWPDTPAGALVQQELHQRRATRFKYAVPFSIGKLAFPFIIYASTL